MFSPHLSLKPGSKKKKKKNSGLRIEKEPHSRSRSSRSRKANGVWNNAVTLRSPLYNSTPLEGVSNSNRAFSTTLSHHLFSSPFWYLRQNCKRQRLNLNYCHFWVLIGGKRMYVSFPPFSMPFPPIFYGLKSWRHTTK